MRSSFEESLAFLASPDGSGDEGGWTYNPATPEVAANYGITIMSFRAWRKEHGLPEPTLEDLKNITPEEVSALYLAKYWVLAGCDALPPGLDYAVFNAAVQSGVSGSRKLLAAVGPGALDARIPAFQFQHLALLEKSPLWKFYHKGWNNRNVRVRERALAMAHEAAI